MKAAHTPLFILLIASISIVDLSVRHRRKADSKALPARLHSGDSHKPQTNAATSQIWAPDETLWTRTETKNLEIFQSRLQMLGCPEQTIQDILIGVIQRQYQAALLSLANSRERPFWYTAERRQIEQDRAPKDSNRQALETEMRDVIRKLLGVDLDERMAPLLNTPDRTSASLSLFSEEVRPAARRVLNAYDDLENSIIQRCSGSLGLPEQAALRQLYDRKLQDLKNLVSPRELDEFELRNSPLAERLRTSDLIGFNPTEGEFRTIFKMAREWQRKNDPGTGEELSFSALPLLELLGEDRYADFMRSQDLTYRALVEFVAYFGFPSETAGEIHQTRESVIRGAAKLHDEGVGDPASLTHALEQMQTLAQTRVKGLLGSEAYAKYVSSSLGDWIQLIPNWTNGVVLRN